MKKFKCKLQHIYLIFFVIVVATAAVVSLFRWVFIIHFELIQLKEEIFELWLPLILPWIPITIWLKPRLKVLRFSKDSDNRRFFFQFIAWGAMFWVLIVSQLYIGKASGKLLTLSSIEQISQNSKVQYYKIDAFDVVLDQGGAHTEFRASGKYNQHLNFDTYFVCPVFTEGDENLDQYWYGVKFKKQISNKISIEEKEESYNAFFEKCINDFENYDFKTLEYFERLPYSDDKAGFLKAIENRLKSDVPKDVVILEPNTERFEDRNGNKFAWIFGSIGISSAIFIFALAFPSIDMREYARQLKGKRPEDKELKDTISFLIPKGEHFATSIILDINIIVYVVMIISGVHIMSPNGMDLLEWGANRRYETINGGWWRLVSSMFLHGGIMHIFMNIYGLVISSIFVESSLGRVKYFVLYFLSGIIGSLASIYWYENTISVGASGAIFGLFGAILAMVVIPSKNREVRKAIFYMIAPFVVINLLFGLTGGIDNAAHIGGLISGFLIGLIFFLIEWKNSGLR